IRRPQNLTVRGLQKCGWDSAHTN
ncbi:uncharacterized protein METZ01_LOCUS343741, partial [marine metagenome]